MKKYIVLFLLSLLTITAQAQIVTLMGSDANTDTVTNAGTTYLTTPVNALNGMTAGAYRIQLDISNVSGTTAGTCILQGTIDGTNWENVYKSTRGTDGIHCDSLTIAAATTHTYDILPNVSKYDAGTATTKVGNAGRYLRLRLKFVGTGTQVSIVKAKLIPQY